MNTSGFDIPHTGLRGEIRNEARDGSTVAQQIGVVYGTAVHNENVYHLEPGARPERRHEVARNFLVGGTPRPAEQILADLLREGEVTTERMYHYFLAVVSDRSFHDIKAEHVDLVSVARKTIALLGRDEWSDAFEVIWEFLTYARMRMQGEEEDNAAVLDAFKALPDARQEEIHLHLQMILSSADQAVLDATRAGRIAVERFSGDRTARAWKFFEPDPAPPRLSMPQATVLERGTWTRAVAGVLLLATALWSAVIGATGVGLAVSLPLLAVGIQLALRHGIVRRAGQAWKQARQSEVTPGPPEEAVSPGHWVPTAFVKDIHRMVDERFSQARPHQAGDWPRYIGGFREHLKRRLVAQYGNARVDASEIDWLINWHARRVASGWSAQELFRFPMPHEPRSTRLSALGIGLACLAIAILALNGALVAAVIIGLGGGLAVEAITHLAGLRRADALLLSDAKALFEQEQAAYEQRCQELADRPTDAEMARWLALDKIYLRNDAMRRAKLGEQDLVTHVVMTEGAQGARARVLNVHHDSLATSCRSSFSRVTECEKLASISNFSAVKRAMSAEISSVTRRWPPRLSPRRVPESPRSSVMSPARWSHCGAGRSDSLWSMEMRSPSSQRTSVSRRTMSSRTTRICSPLRCRVRGSTRRSRSSKPWPRKDLTGSPGTRNVECGGRATGHPDVAC